MVRNNIQRSDLVVIFIFNENLASYTCDSEVCSMQSIERDRSQRASRQRKSDRWVANGNKVSYEGPFDVRNSNPCHRKWNPRTRKPSAIICLVPKLEHLSQSDQV